MGHDRAVPGPGLPSASANPTEGTVHDGPCMSFFHGSTIREHRLRADGTVELPNTGTMTMNDHIESMRREAKRISRATTITHSQALDVLAVQKGFTHWGSLKERLQSRSSPRIDETRGVLTPNGLIEGLIGRSDRTTDGCGDARHLLISGSGATGKTTVLNRMLQEIPDGTTTWSLGTRGDVDGCVMANRTRHPNDRDRDMSEAEYASGARRAIDARAHVLVFDEVSTNNARVILDTVRSDDAPMVIAIIHAADPGYVHDVMRERTGGTAGIVPSDGFALMHMRRDPFTACRVISDIRRI